MDRIGMQANADESSVSGSVALGIYDAMQEMMNARGARIPSRLDPLIQRALHAGAGSRTDPRARARLESMSIQLEHLRVAQRARMADEVRLCTANLAKLTSQWLDQTQVC